MTLEAALRHETDNPKHKKNVEAARPVAVNWNYEPNDEWADEDEQEARLGVDRVLNKYERAKVIKDDSEDFEAQYEMSMKGKMMR